GLPQGPTTRRESTASTPYESPFTHQQSTTNRESQFKDHQSFLFPGNAKRFAHEHRGVRALARPVLLRAAVVDFGNVDVSFLVDAEPVHAPHAAGEAAPRAPR